MIVVSIQANVIEQNFLVQSFERSSNWAPLTMRVDGAALVIILTHRQRAASGTIRNRSIGIEMNLRQWTHLFGSMVEGNINGFFVQSFNNHSGIVATVTGDGLITPTIGNQSWVELGGRLGFRLSKGWVADLFVNGTLGPQPVGNTVHGGIGLRINY
jgi:hypothetical protein